MSAGLDVGTCFVVAARQTDKGTITFRKERTAFFTLEDDSFVKKMLGELGVNYIERKDQILVVGEPALKFANLFHKESSRPLSQGMLSPKEKESVPMLRVLLEEIAGEPKEPKEVIYFSIPANPVDAVKNNIYHEKVIEEILLQKGYTPKSMNEAMAIVYSELSNNKFSGIAISMGAGMCLGGDTRIPLLNGEVKTMRELAEQYGDKEFWVYSCKEDGNIVPGLASNPHKVKTAEVIRIWLDNGKFLDCTPDHKIMTRNGQYKEAQELKENESIMPLYLFDNKIDGRVGYNHKIIRIEKTNKQADVYDFTVKDYHNFAIDSGIFVHNCNVALAYLSVPILTFSIARGGDWVDEMSAMSQGETSSKIQELKEKKLDLSVEQEDILLRAISIHYDALIDYTLKHFVNEFKKSKNLPEISEGIPVVVSGGTSMPKGFVERFKKRLALLDFPLKVSEVGQAADPLNSVARGLLVAAQVWESNLTFRTN